MQKILLIGVGSMGRAIIGLNDTSNGDIIFDGQKINGKKSREQAAELIRRIQMIFQDPAASLNERATVDYIISEGLYNHRLFKDEEERKEKVQNIIREVGLLAEHLTRYPHEFSGGQRQRIGIARALVMQPDFVIADEPISALDVSVRAQVLNLLKKFQKELGLTYLFIAHDLSVVRFISDRIAVIYKGVIVEVCPSVIDDVKAVGTCLVPRKAHAQAVAHDWKQGLHRHGQRLAHEPCEEQDKCQPP